MTDAHYRRRIAGLLELRPDDLVVEIGAGRGAMTGPLAERARRVIAMELDPALARCLEKNFRSEPKVKMLHADVLSVDLAGLCRQERVEKCFVFGNLPYYITSPILNHLRTFWPWIRAMALLVQREVAERIVASPGTRDYGYLSVLAQLHWETRILLQVPPGAFSPPPKVHSALVDFRQNPQFSERGKGVAEEFLEFVKGCFAEKRKNLVNNLARAYPRERVEQEFRRLTWPRNIRAEQLSWSELARLYSRLRSPHAN